MRVRRLLVATVTVAAAAALSSCSTVVTDSGMKALHYHGGVTSGESYAGCVGPGVKQVDNGGNHYYQYPMNQRNWVNDSTGVNDADAPSIPFTSKDGITMNATLITNFFLNTSCKPVDVGGHHYKGGVLEAFHELIGKPRNAWFHGNSYGDGWVWVLGNYVGRPIQQAVSAVGHQYTSQQLWQDPKVRQDMAKQIAQELPTLVNNQMQTPLQFFDDFSVSIDHIDPPESIKQAFIARQTAITKADTAKAQAAAQEAAAKAQIAVEKAKAEVIQQEIKGYGGTWQYLCAKSIEAGMPCFQPNGSVMVGAPTH